MQVGDRVVVVGELSYNEKKFFKIGDILTISKITEDEGTCDLFRFECFEYDGTMEDLGKILLKENLKLFV